MNIPKPLNDWISLWVVTQKLDSNYSIIQLAGDGSTRTFYRLSIPKSGENFVVLFDPSWTLSQDYPAHQKLLKNSKIPVPEFRAVDKKSGILVMEDLGDELLQKRIEKDPKSKLEWLTKCMRLLAELHGNTFPVSPEVPASTRRFDAKKYFEELTFTATHLHEGLLGLPKLEGSGLKQIQEFCEKIEEVSPEVFSHRDYHCRNLLVHNDALVMIDFQDARLGPPHYDIASLVYDAYVPISEKERQDLLTHYKETIASYALNEAVNWSEFDLHLHLIGLQRTLKAAGSFASFYTRYKKSTHLPYLIPALKYSIELRNKVPKDFSKLLNGFPIEKWIETFENHKIK